MIVSMCDSVSQIGIVRMTTVYELLDSLVLNIKCRAVINFFIENLASLLQYSCLIPTVIPRTPSNIRLYVDTLCNILLMNYVLFFVFVSVTSHGTTRLDGDEVTMSRLLIQSVDPAGTNKIGDHLIRA